MITIGKPYIIEEGNVAYLKAKVSITSDTAEAYIGLRERFKKVHWRTSDNYPPREWGLQDSGLWYSVPASYRKYLCTSRGDAFLVAFIWYAMVTESDIKLEVPVSSRMYFYVQHLLIPALMKVGKGYAHQIKVICETTSDPIECANAVGTGMSCGVDSLYTLKLYNSDNVPPEYKLTHLTYFNMGAIFHPDRASSKHYSLEEFYKTTDRMSDEKFDNAQKVADLANLPCIYIQSNMDKDYYRGAYGDTGLYRNFSCVLALQHLFGKYYCSSAGWPDFFELSLDQGSAHYQSLLTDAFTTESCQFIMSDYDTRFEKTELLANDEISQKYLDVCFRFINCGECSKCRRTLITLDLLGKLDLFKDAFDVEKFKKDRANAYAWLLKTKDGDAIDDNVVFAKDIYKHIQDNNIQIPKESYKKYYLWKMKQIPIIRLANKVVRRIRKK